MLWLDSDYPTDQDPSKPGVARGSCSKDSGKPSDVESNHADASVTFSNIRFGEIGSTDGNTPTQKAKRVAAQAANAFTPEPP